MPHPTAESDGTRAEIAALRPDLLSPYDRALPAARAAILARLLVAVETEPLPGLTSRHHRDGRSQVRFGDTVLTYPTVAATPFRDPGAGLHVTVRTGPSRTGPSRSGSDPAEFVPGEPIGDPARLAGLLWPAAGLAAELAGSVANLALARAANPASGRSADGWPTDPQPGQIEQTVVDGHPLHPCCRTRTGMTVADQLAYAPEHRTVITLRRLRVPADRWYGTTEPVLLAHPWQAARLRQQYPWLTDDGPTGPARPLMSLRTVAPLDGGPHVKTAVDIQMTSAVRTVSPAAVRNGPALSVLLQALTRDLPITVLAETAAGAVITGDGPDRRLAHLIRRPPPPGAVPLGVLADCPRRFGDPDQLLQDLAAVFFEPLAQLLNRGVALEAHGQNSLVTVHGGRITHTYYRDLGGIRLHPGRLRAAGHPVPTVHGDLPTDDDTALRTKLAAAALATVARQFIANAGTDPARLWPIVAAALHHHRSLITEPLPVKATTAMRLATDPLLDCWTHLPNPMAAYA